MAIRSDSFPRAVRAWIAAAALTALCGCPPHHAELQVHAPLSLPDAVELINANHRLLNSTLKAVGGHARGQIVDTDGKVRHFDLDAALLVKPPRCLRLDLKALLESQLVFGSNATKYWVVQPAADALSYGRHDARLVPRAGDLIIRPDLLVEALGLNPLPTDTLGDAGPIQRITPEYQQLLFLAYEESGQGYIAKEYWISRRDPQLVTRIIFRDPSGQVALDSQIGNYRRSGPDEPLLPRHIRMSVPASRCWLEFTTWNWKPMAEVSADHPAFAFPLERGETFERIVDLDVELDQLHHPFTDEERLRQLLTPTNRDAPP
jgi:hypothetical protein